MRKSLKELEERLSDRRNDNDIQEPSKPHRCIHLYIQKALNKWTSFNLSSSIPVTTKMF